MRNHFQFADGSNPYISITDKKFFEMLCSFNLDQIGENSFKVIRRRPNYKRTYNAIKDVIREFAIDWQYKFNELNYSYGELADWQEFFTEYGRKYGLMTEFHENCIC